MSLESAASKAMSYRAVDNVVEDSLDSAFRQALLGAPGSLFGLPRLESRSRMAVTLLRICYHRPT